MRMIGPVAILLIFLTAEVSTAEQATTDPQSWTWYKRGVHYVDAGIVLPSDELTLEKVMLIGGVAFGKYSGLPLVVLEILDKDHYPPMHSISLPRDGYELSRVLSDRFGIPSQGRVVIIGKNCVVEYRSTSGRVTRRIIAGEDPLNLRTESGSIRLLHFYFHAIPPALGHGLHKEMVEVFSSADGPLSASVAIEAAAQMRRLLPDLEISLYVRRDEWFIGEPGFPLRYPFSEGKHVPTHAEFAKSQMLVCGWLDKKSGCYISSSGNSR